MEVVKALVEAGADLNYTNKVRVVLCPSMPGVLVVRAACVGQWPPSHPLLPKHLYLKNVAYSWLPK